MSTVQCRYRVWKGVGMRPWHVTRIVQTGTGFHSLLYYTVGKHATYADALHSAIAYTEGR